MSVEIPACTYVLLSYRSKLSIEWSFPPSENKVQMAELKFAFGVDEMIGS